MFSNEVTLLEKENKKQLKELGEDDKLIIKNITSSMSVFKVNSYDAQVITRDLIGMAQELNLRGSSLEDSIGDDLKGFTYEIIKNSGGPSKIEIFLNFLSKLSGYFFILCLFSFFNYGSLSWELSPVIYLFYFGAFIILFIADEILAPIFSTEKGFKNNLQILIGVFMVSAWAIINRLLRDNLHTTSTEVNGILIVGIAGLVFLIVKYLRLKNIQRLAKDKKNYINDLK
jgi:DNA-binding ferritin-like protein (Dps family)